MSSRREGRHPSSRPSHLPTPSQHPLSHLPQHQQDHLNIPPQDPQRNSDSSFLTLSLPSDIQDFFLGDNPTYDEPLLLHGGFGVSAKKERGVGKTKIEVPSVKVNPDDPSMKRNRKQEMERLGNESSRRSIARSEDTLFRPSLSQESRPSRAMDVPPPPQIPLKDPLERTGIPMHSASDPLSRRRVDDTLWKQRVDDAHVVKHAASDSFLMVGENPSMDRGTGSLGSRLARRSNMSLSIDTRSPNDIRRSKSPLEKVEGGDAVEKTEVPSQNMNEEPPMEMQKSKGLSENEPTVMNVTDFAELKARRLQGVGLQRSLTNQVIGMPNVGESGTPNTLQGILEKRTQATRRPSNKGNVHFRTPSMEGQTKSNWFGVGRGNTNTTITSDAQFMALQNSTTAKEDVLSPTTSVRTMVDFPRDLAMGDLEECLFIEREAYGEDPDAFYARVMKEDKRKEDDEDGGVGGVVLTRRFKRALVHFLYVEDLELFDEVAAFKEMYPEVDKMEAHEHFAGRGHSDAMVKIVYADNNTHWDAILKYQVAGAPEAEDESDGDSAINSGMHHYATSAAAAAATTRRPHRSSYWINLGNRDVESGTMEVEEQEDEEIWKERLKRACYERELLRHHLVLVRERGVDVDVRIGRKSVERRIHYVKVVASFDTLCLEAERIKLKMEVSERHMRVREHFYRKVANAKGADKYHMNSRQRRQLRDVNIDDRSLSNSEASTTARRLDSSQTNNTSSSTSYPRPPVLFSPITIHSPLTMFFNAQSTRAHHLAHHGRTPRTSGTHLNSGGGSSWFGPGTQPQRSRHSSPTTQPDRQRHAQSPTTQRSRHPTSPTTQRSRHPTSPTTSTTGSSGGTTPFKRLTSKQFREGPDGTFVGTFNFIFSLVPDPIDLESDAFDRTRLAEFKGGGGVVLGKTFAQIRLDFFPNSKSNLLVHIIAQRCKIHQQDGNAYNIGINHLLLESVYTDFYAVHDGPYRILSNTSKPQHASSPTSSTNPSFTPSSATPSCPPPPHNPNVANQRAFLYEAWSRLRFTKSALLLEQPLRQIRDYFGERIAYYFAFLGFYTLWLVIPALVGMGVAAFGARHAIDEGWANAFDNALTTPFAFFMAVWAALFLEFWKRQEATLNTVWDVLEVEQVETKRPEWYGVQLRRSPITGKIELHFPKHLEIIIKIITSFILFFAILLMVGFEVIIILTHAAALSLKTTLVTPTNVASVVAGVMTLFNIIFLTPIYLRLSHMLNRWENHRTLEKFDNSLIFKSFIVSFVNNYSTLTYVGFIKVFVGRNLPNIGLVVDSCDPLVDDPSNPLNSCMSQLMLNMLVVFVGLQFFNQIRMVIAPLFRQRVRRILRGTFIPKATPQHVQDDLLDTWHQREEFTAKMVQFGFIALFSCGFPLAPFFALLNNAVEIRFGAYRLVAESRRPFVSRTQGIGAWIVIANMIARMGVLFNALTIAFSSRYFNRVYLAGLEKEYHLAAKMIFVLVFENAVFLIVFIIDWLVPDIPGKVKHAIQRQKYLARIESGEEIEDEDEVSEADLGIKLE